MLILSRAIGENFKVFKNENYQESELDIFVLSASHNRVTLGIRADDIYNIYRNEIYEKIANEKNIPKIKDVYTKEDIIRHYWIRRKQLNSLRESKEWRAV